MNISTEKLHLRQQFRYAIYTVISLAVFMGVSCDIMIDDRIDVSESMDPIEKVVKVSCGDSVKVTVNRNPKQEAYFNIDFSNVLPNDVVKNGSSEGWCIDWQKSINSNQGVYKGVKLYSTYGSDKWKPINYLLNIKDELIEEKKQEAYRI